MEENHDVKARALVAALSIKGTAQQRQKFLEALVEQEAAPHREPAENGSHTEETR